jgi:hypothetical protein
MLVTRICVPVAWAIGCIVLGVSGVCAAQQLAPKYTNAEVLSISGCSSSGPMTARSRRSSWTPRSQASLTCAQATR